MEKSLCYLVFDTRVLIIRACTSVLLRPKVVSQLSVVCCTT